MNKIEYTVWVFDDKNHQCDRIETTSKATGKALVRTVMRRVRRRMANPKNAWMYTGQGGRWRADRVLITTKGRKVRGFVPILTVAEVKL